MEIHGGARLDPAALAPGAGIADCPIGERVPVNGNGSRS
jgi:hypothetical protein